MEYLVAAYTDVGISKETNQDSICVRRAFVSGVGETVLAVVCDGMGGLKSGEIASATAVDAFGRWFDSQLSHLHTLCAGGFSRVRLQWSDLLEEIHRDMIRYSVNKQVQIGTTVTAFFAYADRYLTLTIGDSRIYERKESLRLLTQDQSLVAREIAAGRISEEESKHHPQRNILLQCVGTGEHITPVFTEGAVRNEALYLLCSDGLVHEVSSDELKNSLDPVFLHAKDSMTSALCSLTELYKTRGEKDNITAVLLRTNESKHPEEHGNRVKKLFKRFFDSSQDAEDEKGNVSLLETAQIIHTQEVIGR